jgi:hypothetical protein
MMNKRRVLEIVAMLMIGEGVLCQLFPRRHVLLWKFGPARYSDAMRSLAGRPGLTRLLGLLEAALGIWLAAAQHRD